MSAVREWAATIGKKAYKSVGVSDWGKYKTGIQVLQLCGSVMLHCSDEACKL